MTPDDESGGTAADPPFTEAPLAEFANELSAAAEDAAQMLASRVEHAGAAPASAFETEASLSIQNILRIPVTMKVVVGSATLPVADLKNLKKGDTVPLNRRVGESVDIIVNGQIVARGTLVIVDDESAQLGVSLKEIVDASTPGGPLNAARRQ